MIETQGKRIVKSCLTKHEECQNGGLQMDRELEFPEPEFQWAWQPSSCPRWP